MRFLTIISLIFSISLLVATSSTNASALKHATKALKATAVGVTLATTIAASTLVSTNTYADEGNNRNLIQNTDAKRKGSTSFSSEEKGLRLAGRIQLQFADLNLGQRTIHKYW